MAVRVVRNEDGFDLPPLDREEGSSFGWYDRFSQGMDPLGKYVTDFTDWEARDLHEMLSKDYKSRQMESVLALPIISATRTIVPAKGDKGEAEWLQAFWDQDHLSGGCNETLDQIVDRMTSAFSYKRAYMEKVWTMGSGDFDGKIVYDSLGWRPQTTCRLIRDPRNGNFLGFEQEPYYIGPEISRDKWPIKIPPARAFVYTHGTRRDPMNGTSDMEIAFWAWKTKQKILLLWFQFLQAVALPRIVVKANDGDTATGIAQQIAKMKSSGVLPVAVPGGPASVGIEALDVSGKGADQFLAAIGWLDNAATQSILAGFLNLTDRGQPVSATGSFALSADASDFFLQSEEAKTHEIEDAVRRDLFAPIVYHNFGRDAAIPRYNFEPLNSIDKSAAIQLLTSAMAAPPGGPVPVEFIGGLAEQVSTYLGLEGAAMKSAFVKSFNAAAEEAKAKAAAEMPGGVGGIGEQVAQMHGAVSAATEAAKKGARGVNGRPTTFKVPKRIEPGQPKKTPLHPEAQAALDAKKAPEPKRGP